MSGQNHGNIASGAELFRFFCNAAVMALKPGDHFFLVFREIFAEGERNKVCVAQVWDGTDDEFGFSGFLAESDDFLFRFGGGGAENVDGKCGAEQFTRGIQERRRIVIAAGDDRRPARCLLKFAEKFIIETDGGIRGGGGVEDIPRDDERVDFALLDRVENPVQKRGELVVALPVVELVSDVPVGCMENSHQRKMYFRMKSTART